VEFADKKMFFYYEKMGIYVFCMYLVISLILGIILGKIYKRNWFFLVVAIIMVFIFYYLDLDISLYILLFLFIATILSFIYNKFKK